MKKKITIIDYGSGNILSAKQSFAKAIKTNDIRKENLIHSFLSSVRQKMLTKRK